MTTNNPQRNPSIDRLPLDWLTDAQLAVLALVVWAVVISLSVWVAV